MLGTVGGCVVDVRMRSEGGGSELRIVGGGLLVVTSLFDCVYFVNVKREEGGRGQEVSWTGCGIEKDDISFQATESVLRQAAGAVRRPSLPSLEE